MSQFGARALPSLRLRDAVSLIRREATTVIGVALVVGALSTIAVVLLAQSRILLFMAVPTRSDDTVIGVAALLVFWTFAAACISHLRERLQTSLGYRVSHRLSVAAIIAAAEVRETPDRGAALADVEEVSSCVSGPVVTAAVDAALVPIMILVLLSVHWGFLALTLFAAVLKLSTALVMKTVVKQPLQDASAAQRRAIFGIADVVQSAEAVEAMGMLPAVARRWISDVQGGVNHMARTQRIIRIAQAVSQLVDLLMSAAPIALLTILVLAGLDPGFSGVSGMFVLLIMPSVVGPFTRMVDMSTEISAAFRAWDRLRLLAADQAEHAPAHSIFLCPNGRLEVDRLTVVLPGSPYPIINDMSFRVDSGQVIAFSGPVGSGKSTLLRVVMGIQRPSNGGCYLDGHATWQWDRQDFAQYVGYLPQELGLADGTVADVIARLRVPDMALVLEAAQRSGAHDFIVTLPKGYSTRLSEYGLSAGQRQRLGLARAIYGRPRLVVLDEPGAWLDANGLAQLRRLIGLLRRDRTTVLISSHEPGLLDEADHTITLGGHGVRPRAAARKRLTAPQAQPVTP